jgi:hypothetical protein
MPSHSKKQHNFMEAIAHSPSFAKKVHIPQSVGKDYAAADKGKTFGKGGEMKESKAMVGKEVAFFKKKGAPAKMIKHEMSEMKGMKAGGRVRKMAGGGFNDMGEGSALSNRSYGYEEEKEQGAKNLESIKNFFGFGKKKDEAPIDRSRDKPEPVIRPSMGGPSTSSGTSRVSSQSPRTRRENEDTSDSDAVERSDAAMLAASRDKTTKGPQFISSIAKDEGEYSGDGLSPARRDESRNRPATVSRTRETTSVTPAKSKTPANANYRKLLNDAEQEILSKTKAEEDALRKKPTAMTEQMRKAPSIRELYKGQKSMGDEIGDALKSFRASIRSGLKVGEERSKNRNVEASAAKGGQVKRMRYGGSPDDGMDMGQPMRGVRAPTGSPQMPAAARMRAQQEAQKMKGVGTGGIGAGGIDRRSDIGTMGMQPSRPKTGIGFNEGQGYGNRGPQPTLPPRPIEPPMMEDKVPPMPKPDYEKPGYQLPMERPMPAAGPRIPIDTTPKEPKGLPGQTPEELIQEKNRKIFNSGMTQSSQPGGSPQQDGPSRGIKAGGQVKKMAQGGYAKADGVASRGKTQPKMVKMAKGGFVKTADGCAQRGKTKAFQVKMNRGGKC